MTAREQETLARRLWRIARRGMDASEHRYADRKARYFGELDPAVQAGWRHLAGWLWMDRKHVLKGALS